MIHGHFMRMERTRKAEQRKGNRRAERSIQSFWGCGHLFSLVTFVEHPEFELIPHPQFSFETKDEKAMRRCMSSDYAQLHLASPRPELMGPDYSSMRDAVLPRLTILALARP